MTRTSLQLLPGSGRLIAAGLVMLFTTAVRAATSAVDRDFFESKIRPILAQVCYECHSAAGKKKGGLLLDSRAGWQAGGETGPVIIPGDASKSLFMQAIRHEKEDLKMPKAGAKLVDGAIADFEKWIDAGAPDPRDKPPSKAELAEATDWKQVLARRKTENWAFRPVGNPPVPQTRSTGAGHPVDRFLLKAIEDAGLRRAPRADATAILRRLTFVLTGLPPNVEEAASFERAFARDPGAAVAAAADALLASPRFGERWARHWMDWVRYAESYGSEGDPAIPYAWRYRDYLIRAFNNDVPYPQLVREAIAGDLLPRPRINRELGINESALGIGQLRMVLHGFSPVDSLDEMVNFTDNQIDVVSKAFLGLTVSCARCHNHKFDPVSQTDFYAMFGIFSSTHPAVIDARTGDGGAIGRDGLIMLKAQIKDAIGKAWLAAAAALPRIEGSQEHKTIDAVSRWDLSREKWFADGDGVRRGPTKPGEFSIAPAGGRMISHIHPGGVFTDLISTKDRGVLMSPRFANGGGTLWMRCAGGGGARARYIVDNYPRTGTIHKATDLKVSGDSSLGWRRLDLEYWKGDEIFIQVTTAADMPVETKPDARSWFGITGVVITRNDEQPPEPRPSGDPLAAVRAWIAGAATDGQAELLDALLRDGKLPNDSSQVPEAAALVARYREIEAGLPGPVRAPGVLEADGRDAALFAQGDHKRPGDLVPRRFLEAIDARPYFARNDGTSAAGGRAAHDGGSAVVQAPSGRLQLAESLVRPDNPLTARVIVNRVWHHVFGRGIVSTTDNFGRLGEAPTHPELIDYLASRFTAEGGSLKNLIRMLVTSETFQMDSHARPGVAERDPENKLLARFPVRRLEAEAIRDSMLVVSGVLDPQLFGESVGGGDARRSVYVRVNRNSLDPLLGIFDAPVPSSTRGRRDVTNVPAQSLALLNDPNVNRWAEAWARRVMADPSLKDDDARIRRMFAEALGRPPSKSELGGSLSFVKAVANGGDAAQEELVAAEERAQALQRGIEAVLGPARERLERLAKQVQADGPAPESMPEPFAEWDFERGYKDQRGRLDLTLEGGARIENGALVLNGGKSYAKSAVLTKTLGEKTMEVWLMLENLEQRGGGVMTLQDDRGEVFDSIVFAEKEKACWVPGSDHFRRSKNLGAPGEQDAAGRVVHVAIVYGADGTVTAYRDGRPLGNPYQSEGPATFESGRSEVLFGLRHGTSAGGNRVLSGRIYRARLYDRALSAGEVAGTWRLEGPVIIAGDVLASLPSAARDRVEQFRARSEEAQGRLQELREIGRGSGPDSAWKGLAQSLFNLKEFIYLR